MTTKFIVTVCDPSKGQWSQRLFNLSSKAPFPLLRRSNRCSIKQLGLIMSSLLNTMDSKLKRRKALAKMALPVLFCVVGASYYLTGGNAGDNLEVGGFFNPERNLAPGRRSLAEYDQTTTSLPAWTSTFANVWDPMLPTDTPTMWYETKVRVSRHPLKAKCIHVLFIL